MATLTRCENSAPLREELLGREQCCAYGNSSANTDVEANILLDVPFGKVRVKIPKNGLELLSEASDVTVFKVVSQVVKGGRAGV